MSDYQTNRILSDVQSKIANIDYRLLRSFEHGGEAGPGRRLVFQVAAGVSRKVGIDTRAVEQEAAVPPAQSTVAGWACTYDNADRRSDQIERAVEDITKMLGEARQRIHRCNAIITAETRRAKPPRRG
jgi:hypothetical protein